MGDRTFSRRDFVALGAAAALGAAVAPAVRRSAVASPAAPRRRVLVVFEGQPVDSVLSMSADGRRVLVTPRLAVGDSPAVIVSPDGTTQRLPAPPGGDSMNWWRYRRLNSSGTIAFRVDRDNRVADTEGRISLLHLDSGAMRDIDLDLSTPGRDDLRRTLAEVVDISADGSIIGLIARNDGGGSHSFLADTTGALIDPGVDGIETADEDGNATLATMSADADRVTYAVGGAGSYGEWVEWTRSTGRRERFPIPADRSSVSHADRTLSTFVGERYPAGVEMYGRTGPLSTPSLPGSVRRIVVTTTGAAIIQVHEPARGIDTLVHAALGDDASRFLLRRPDGEPFHVVGTWATSDDGGTIACSTDDTAVDPRVDPDLGSVVIEWPDDSAADPRVASPIDRPTPAGGLAVAERRVHD